jgi:surface protein
MITTTLLNGERLECGIHTTVTSLKKSIQERTGTRLGLQQLYSAETGELVDTNVPLVGTEFYMIKRSVRTIENKETLHKLINQWVDGDRKELEEIYGSIDLWDVSKITDMSYLFQYHTDSPYLNTTKMFVFDTFNEDISEWDVSNVENMSCMFANCRGFNQNLNKWDVSKVKYMYQMFWGCYVFNGDISNWNVSNVKDFRDMFDNCFQFKGDISKWDLAPSKV